MRRGDLREFPSDAMCAVVVVDVEDHDDSYCDVYVSLEMALHDIADEICSESASDYLTNQPWLRDFVMYETLCNDRPEDPNEFLALINRWYEGMLVITMNQLEMPRGPGLR